MMRALAVFCALAARSLSGKTKDVMQSAMEDSAQTLGEKLAGMRETRVSKSDDAVDDTFVPDRDIANLDMGALHQAEVNDVMRMAQHTLDTTPVPTKMESPVYPHTTGEAAAAVAAFAAQDEAAEIHPEPKTLEAKDEAVPAAGSALQTTEKAAAASAAGKGGATWIHPETETVLKAKDEAVPSSGSSLMHTDAKAQASLTEGHVMITMRGGNIVGAVEGTASTSLMSADELAKAADDFNTKKAQCILDNTAGRTAVASTCFDLGEDKTACDTSYEVVSRTSTTGLGYDVKGDVTHCTWKEDSVVASCAADGGAEFICPADDIAVSP